MVWQILGAYQIAISFFIMFMYLLHQGRLDRLSFGMRLDLALPNTGT